VEIKYELTGGTRESVPDILRFENKNVILQDRTFTFDELFTGKATQIDVYNSTAKTYLSDILQGYNCTIFAYGQSGSGKTHTMFGNTNNPGIMLRFIEDIFKELNNEDVRNPIQTIIRISFVEIYLEKIRDLLSEKENLKIFQKDEGFWIQGMVEEQVSSYEEAYLLLQQGNLNRNIGETKLNQKSSRSHAVFIINIDRYNGISGEKTNSKVVLVDLAGSEKVSKTGATGLLLQQAKYTNRSLTNLGLVIRALVNKENHIPYRNSKLTQILANSLGGNSKTCLLITCSLSSYNLEETLSTLRFGTQAKIIKNSPKKNVEKTISEYKVLLDKAYQEIENLKEIIEKKSIFASSTSLISPVSSPVSSPFPSPPPSPKSSIKTLLYTNQSDITQDNITQNICTHSSCEEYCSKIIFFKEKIIQLLEQANLTLENRCKEYENILSIVIQKCRALSKK